jgi:hypothetical protein
MNSQKWTDKYDVKIHRTLLLNPHDHCLYLATSLCMTWINSTSSTSGLNPCQRGEPNAYRSCDFLDSDERRPIMPDKLRKELILSYRRLR